MQERQIILASTSPRRKELMSKTRLPFLVVPSDYEEDMSLDLPPDELAQHLSRGKAEAVAKRYPNAIVIGADTLVAHDNQILGKPKSEAEAREMLRLLSGTNHSIITGLTVIDTATGTVVSRSVETKVYIKELSESEIDAYIASGEPMDKAGAYAIQELGAVFIEKIEGDYMSAIGLPLFELAKIFKSFGMNIL